jgi:hypothetical protein
MTTAPHPLAPERRTLIIVIIKEPRHWDHGKEQLLQQVEQHMNLVLNPAVPGKWFWIGTIGPHWVYGEKEDGQDVKPLIEWHDTTFDDSSRHDFEQLASLVGSVSV